MKEYEGSVEAVTLNIASDEMVEIPIYEEENEDQLDALKSEVAWVLGMEEGSDEWYELMDI